MPSCLQGKSIYNYIFLSYSMFKLISQQEAIDALRGIKHKIGAEKVILFGSIARNQQHELSDMDAIFVMDTDMRFHKRIGFVLDQYRGDLPIEPLVYTPEEFEKMKGSPTMDEMLRGAVEV